jgi:hypothetical protein
MNGQGHEEQVVVTQTIAGKATGPYVKAHGAYATPRAYQIVKRENGRITIDIGSGYSFSFDGNANQGKYHFA